MKRRMLPGEQVITGLMLRNQQSVYGRMNPAQRLLPRGCQGGWRTLCEFSRPFVTCIMQESANGFG